MSGGALHSAVDSRRVTVPEPGVPRSTRLDVPDTPIPSSRADVGLSVRGLGDKLIVRATVPQDARDEFPGSDLWPPVSIDEDGARELARVCLTWLRGRGRL